MQVVTVRTVRRAAWLAAVLALLACCAPAAARAEAIGDEPQVIASSEAQDPDVSPTTIVWLDGRNGWDNADIYGYDRATQTEFPVCTDPAWQGNPRVSGDWVVWLDTRNGDGDIYAYNMKTHVEKAVCTAPGLQSFPEIDGTIVVWNDFRDDSNGDVYGYDLSTDKEFLVAGGEGMQGDPHISGTTVVWQYSDWPSFSGTQLYACDLSDKVAFAVSPVGSQWDLDIDGSKVVWADNGIKGYDIQTKTSFDACDDPDAFSPRLSDGNVTYLTSREIGYQTYAYDVHVADLQSGDTWTIARDLSWAVAAAIDGTSIAYSGNSSVRLVGLHHWNVTAVANGGCGWATAAPISFALWAESQDATVTEMRFGEDAYGGATWGNWQPYAATGTYALTHLPYAYPVGVEFRDDAGHISAPLYANLGIDTTMPTLKLTPANSVAAMAWRNTAAHVDAAAADTPSGVARIQYRLDRGDWKRWPALGFTLLAPASHANDGVHSLQVRATDKAGNMTKTLARTIRIDTVRPALAITSATCGGGYATVKFRIKDAAPCGTKSMVAIRVTTLGGVVKQSLFPIVWFAKNTTVSYRFGCGLPHGSYKLAMLAFDGAGNVSPWSTRAMTVR